MRRIVQAVIVLNTFTILAMLSACTSTDTVSSKELKSLTCVGFCDYLIIESDIDSDTDAVKRERLKQDSEQDPELIPVPTHTSQ